MCSGKDEVGDAWLDQQQGNFSVEYYTSASLPPPRPMEKLTPTERLDYLQHSLGRLGCHASPKEKPYIVREGDKFRVYLFSSETAEEYDDVRDAIYVWLHEMMRKRYG